MDVATVTRAAIARSPPRERNRGRAQLRRLVTPIALSHRAISALRTDVLKRRSDMGRRGAERYIPSCFQSATGARRRTDHRMTLSL